MEEKTSQHQEQSNKAEDNQAILQKIETKVLALTQEYGKKFKADAYRSAAWSVKGQTELLNSEDFLEKEKEEENSKNPDKDRDKNTSEDKNKDKNEDTKTFSDGQGQSFKIEKQKDKMIATGKNGMVLEGKDFEEITDKICANVKQQSLSENRESQISLHAADENERQIFSRTAIMKHGMVIGRDGYSQDPKFWQEMKKEYLNTGKGRLSEWERMTRNIPDDIMQRTPEERARNRRLLDEAQIRSLRGMPYRSRNQQDSYTDAQVAEKPNVDKDFVTSLRNGENPNMADKSDKSTVRNVAGKIAKEVVADIAVKAAAKVITGL